MKKEIKKIYQGKVSVRDMDVRKCKKAKEDLVITHDGCIMTVPFEKLDYGTKTTRNVKSKFKDQVYDLVDYIWWPDKEKPKSIYEPPTLF